MLNVNKISVVFLVLLAFVFTYLQRVVDRSIEKIPIINDLSLPLSLFFAFIIILILAHFGLVNLFIRS